MRFFFLILTFLTAQQFFPQAGFISAAKKKKTFSLPFELFAGKKLVHQTFYAQTNTFNAFDAARPLNLLGLGVNGHFVMTRGHDWFGHANLLMLLPQTISINNTEQAYLYGYSVALSLYGFNLLNEKKRNELVISAGLNAGNTCLGGHQQLRQKNAFIGPMASSYIKIYIRNFSIAFNLQYDYDITNPNWKKSWFVKTEQMQINKWRQSGLSAFLCFGFN